MRIPADTAHADPNWLVGLLDGLAAYSDSLYTAWRMENEPMEAGESDGGNHLPWMGYDSNTRLLMDIRNILHVDQAVKGTKPGGEPDIHLIDPPKLPETQMPDEQDATFASMIALLGGVKG